MWPRPHLEVRACVTHLGSAPAPQQLDGGSRSLFNAHAYKNVGVHCGCVAVAHPLADGGLVVHTHIHTHTTHVHTLCGAGARKHSHTHTFTFTQTRWLLLRPCNKYKHVPCRSQWNQRSTPTWAFLPRLRRDGALLPPFAHAPPGRGGSGGLGFVFGGSGCQPGVQRRSRPHHAD